MCKLDIEVVKKFITTVEDEEGEDDYYEENTVQMLEKFAEEEDDGGDYYISSGGNYSYMYDSPYNPDQDQHLIVQQLVNICSNIETITIKPT